MFLKFIIIDLIIKLKLFIVIINVKTLSNTLNSVFYINININITVININKGFFLKQLSFIWIYK